MTISHINLWLLIWKRDRVYKHKIRPIALYLSFVLMRPVFYTDVYVSAINWNYQQKIFHSYSSIYINVHCKQRYLRIPSWCKYILSSQMYFYSICIYNQHGHHNNYFLDLINDQKSNNPLQPLGTVEITSSPSSNSIYVLFKIRIIDKSNSLMRSLSKIEITVIFKHSQYLFAQAEI